MDWAKNGSYARTIGYGNKIEAIKISLTNKNIIGNIKYSSYVKGIGWQKDVIDGAISGTTGQGLALEGYQIKLVKKKKQRTMIKKMNMFQK